MESDGLISEAYQDFVRNEANILLEQSKEKQLIEDQQENSHRELPQDQPERYVRNEANILLEQSREKQLIESQQENSHRELPQDQPERLH